MKSTSLLFAVLLGCLALNSRSAEISVGAEVSPLAVWADQCVLLIDRRQEDQGGHSNGYGVRVGLVLPHDDTSKTSLEIGYDKLGNISGSTVYSLNPGCIILCPGATSTWKHETSIVHASALWFLPWNDRKEHGAVIGKIGLYSSSTNAEGDYGTGAGAYSRTVSGAGCCSVRDTFCRSPNICRQELRLIYSSRSKSPTLFSPGTPFRKHFLNWPWAWTTPSDRFKWRVWASRLL